MRPQFCQAKHETDNYRFPHELKSSPRIDKSKLRCTDSIAFCSVTTLVVRFLLYQNAYLFKRPDREIRPLI